MRAGLGCGHRHDRSARSFLEAVQRTHRTMLGAAVCRRTGYFVVPPMTVAGPADEGVNFMGYAEPLSSAVRALTSSRELMYSVLNSSGEAVLCTGRML